MQMILSSLLTRRRNVKVARLLIWKEVLEEKGLGLLGDLYADDHVIIADSLEECVKRPLIQVCKNYMEKW